MAHFLDKNSQMRMANLIQRKSSKSKRMVHFAKSVDAADGSVKHVPNVTKNMSPSKTHQMSRNQKMQSQQVITPKMPTPRKVAKRHLNHVTLVGVRDDGQTPIDDVA